MQREDIPFVLQSLWKAQTGERIYKKLHGLDHAIEFADVVGKTLCERRRKDSRPKVLTFTKTKPEKGDEQQREEVGQETRAACPSTRARRRYTTC